jgi:hypothetical protein
MDGVRAIALSQIQFGAQAGLKETAQDLAMDGTKADLQLQERAGLRVSLNQGAPSTEIWVIAALDQRRRRTQNHLAKIASRRESWIKHNRYYYDCWVAFFGSWWSCRKKCYRFVVAPATF